MYDNHLYIYIYIFIHHHIPIIIHIITIGKRPFFPSDHIFCRSVLPGLVRLCTAYQDDIS